MKRLYTVVLTALVVWGFTLVCQAQEQPPAGAQAQAPKAKGPGDGARQIFQKADKDQDGKVTFEEVSAAFPQMTQEKFDKMDRDKDGAITKADAPPDQRQQMQQVMKKADADKDGKVTLEEAQKAMPKMTAERFTKLDKDADGALTSADLPAMNGQGPADKANQKAAMRGRIARADANGDKNVTLEEFMAQPGSTEEMFKRLDRNGDGGLSEADAQVSPVPAVNQAKPFDPARLDTNKDEKLSYEEATAFYPALAREAFDRLDANKDGFITMDEIAKPAA